MQSIIAITLAALAASVSAAPTPSDNTVGVQFSNIVTGANGDAEIPLDNTPVVVGQAFGNGNPNSDLEVDGKLLVTSLQFVRNFQDVKCVVIKVDGNKQVANIADPAMDFQTFSSTPLNWVAGFNIQCTK